jgi:hypothetical protein
MKSLEREEHYPLKRSTFAASNEKPSLEVTRDAQMWGCHRCRGVGTTADDRLSSLPSHLIANALDCVSK